MVYWFLKIQKHVTFSILKIQRIISYHKFQNIEWLICWTFTKIRKILHPSENNTPVTICRNQESGIEKSFRRKTPCTYYSHKTLSGTFLPSMVPIHPVVLEKNFVLHISHRVAMLNYVPRWWPSWIFNRSKK
jgi:hypothetical protein